jgi:Xaa-Pro dipeptidase
MQIERIQEQLEKLQLDGWLLYDFQGSNPIARKLTGLQSLLLTRRWFYWIPRQGSPSILCHRIERHAFNSLEGDTISFKSWEEMIQGLQGILSGSQTVAMEYSPQCSVPYVSRVDAGTIELIRGLAKQVVSSADLVQHFEASWSHEQFQMHQQASERLMKVLFSTFTKIKSSLKNNDTLSEYSVQQWMLEQYRMEELFSFSPPIVAVNANSGNPHYEPSSAGSAPIRAGDFLLIDLWAKLQKPGAVYADYTWVAYLGPQLPAAYVNIWEIVKGSRDAAVAFIKNSYPQRIPLEGWQVDKIARDFINQRGYGDYFIHRTGHSIGEEDHGNGANMDSLETRDTRRLIPHTCFSIEPGIYLDEFGIRSEVNVFLEESEVIVTGEPVQQDIIALWA